MFNLKPCFLCKGEGVMMIKSGFLKEPFLVMCIKCRYELPVSYETREDAAEAWNIRYKASVDPNFKIDQSLTIKT